MIASSKSPDLAEVDAELRAGYSEEGIAVHYAKKRWTRSWRARRTHNKELRIVESFLAACGELKTILDVPTGSGRFVPALGQNCRELWVGDISMPMLKSRPNTEGMPERSVVCSANRLPFVDNCFEMCFCMRLFHHYKDPVHRRHLLRELARCSRKWVIVNYFDYHCLQAWRHRCLGRNPRRYPISTTEFQSDLQEAGLECVHRRFIARKISEQVLVLLRKVDTDSQES